MIERLPGSGEDDVHPPPPPATRGPVLAGQGPAFAAVAVGGAAGSLGRYGLAHALPTAEGGFPWATFLTNVLGCLLIGALVVVLTELVPAHPLLRPFLITGVLGGFTTFSTYCVEIESLLAGERVGTALAYLAGTVVAALLATWVGLLSARAVGALT